MKHKTRLNIIALVDLTGIAAEGRTPPVWRYLSNKTKKIIQ